MTWSILACDAPGRVGVTIARGSFAVGALCVHAAEAHAMGTAAT